MPQITAAMVPTAMFPDGSTLISYGGISYRASWNGVTMIMEPLQTLPLAADQHLHATGHVQAQVSNPLLRASQLLQAPTTSTQLASSNNGSQHRAENSNGLVTSQAAGNSEGDFKAQLTNLDRYLALYHYDITSAERAAYVTKRRYLVEEIDKIRVSKEQPKRVIPIIEPITRAHVTAEAQHGPKFQAKQVVPSSMHSAGQKLVSAKDAMNNKALSAAAPAFVPRSQESGPSSSPNLLATGQHSKQFARLEVSEPRLRNHAAFNLKDVTNAAISRKDRALHAYDMSTKDTSHRHASSSSVLDLSDPAMRIIDYEDIEYASRYLYNWTQDTKTYCTTVAEFQEAIRRVREQACMYGCEGGQSKDPAYDAEQDIWWAICDRDPIPLPSIVPDHVANPRPWNWNDSAFNYRRKGSPWPGPECDKARNSPRLAGWDPIVTEAMKDKMDVSRSYFALKGQLSSVPFRDFAYDRHGNKVMTESGTASDVPDIEAPSDSSDRDASFATEGGNGPQNAPQANNRALRNMSTNDLNGRHTAPKKTTRNKSSRKKNITDGDAIKPSSQSAMRTPQHKPIQSKIKANLAIDGIISASNSRDSDVQIKSICKNPQPNRPPHQAYVEECLETPATRHMRADSKGSPTAQSRILSRTWSNQKGLDASAKNDQSIITPDPTTKEEHIPYSTPGWVTEPTNVNDPWYGPPTDPVTLDYLARLKTWCPGDPDVLETMAAEQEKRAEDETAEAFQKAINQSVYGIDDSRHNSTWDTHDVSAETRSPWGPEQDSPFFEPCQRFKRPDSQLPADSFEAGKIAKVKIPNATYNRVLFAGENPMQPLHAGIAGHSALETQAIKPTKVDRSISPFRSC